MSDASTPAIPPPGQDLNVGQSTIAAGLLPGVAALLLARGCDEYRLDEALAMMTNWALPATLTEAVEHADNAIAELPDK